MPLESEYFPEQTSRLNSLPPEDRKVYKKLLWGLVGTYAAVAVIMGAVLFGHIGLQKTADVAVTRTSAR